jgi:hypothetical protein
MQQVPSPVATGSPLIRSIGVLVSVCSLLTLLYLATSFDVSVPIEGGTRVNNLGLMQDKQNGIIISIFAFFVGVGMFFVGQRYGGPTIQEGTPEASSSIPPWLSERVVSVLFYAPIALMTLFFLEESAFHLVDRLVGVGAWRWYLPIFPFLAQYSLLFLQPYKDSEQVRVNFWHSVALSLVGALLFDFAWFFRIFYFVPAGLLLILCLVMLFQAHLGRTLNVPLIGSLAARLINAGARSTRLQKGVVAGSIIVLALGLMGMQRVSGYAYERAQKQARHIAFIPFRPVANVFLDKLEKATIAMSASAHNDQPSYDKGLFAELQQNYEADEAINYSSAFAHMREADFNLSLAAIWGPGSGSPEALDYVTKARGEIAKARQSLDDDE